MSQNPEAGGTNAHTGLLPSFALRYPGERPRMLFVHAHPDDESIATGATMAGYAAAGADVVLLTCTRGEMGEVIGEELQHLQAGHPACGDNGEALAQLRAVELAEAVAALGISRQVFLGAGDALEPAALEPEPLEPDALEPDRAPVRFRDSGMAWGESGRAEPAGATAPGAFATADLAATAAHAAALIGSFRPHAVITYDADGGYGHPDHVRAHEMTHAALQAASAQWATPWVYSIHSDWDGATPAGRRPQVSITGDLERKQAAMRAHQTQIVVEDSRFALSNGIWQPLTATEVFLLEEASPMDAPDPPPRVSSWARPSKLAGIAGAVGAGLAATFCGTALYGHILYLPGFALPWGAVAALALVGSLATVAGLWARTLWIAILTGVITYILVGVAAMGSRVIITDAGSLGTPPIAVAGQIWVLGIGVATIVAAVICQRRLKQRRGAIGNRS